MTRMRILTEPDIRALVRLDADVIACVENAFAALAGGAVVMPPILRLDIAQRHGEVDVKSAYVPGLDSFAIKVSSGFFDNPGLGLPSLNGMMLILSARTGLPEALLLDNGYLTDLRTAAAGAVAARHLSRPDSQIAAILGAGVQASLQLEALMLVRPITSARIWGRDPGKARAAARDVSQRLSIPVEAAATPEAACRGADIIVTTTPATQPILQVDWLRPGQHITAMGSDAEHKNEIAAAAMAKVSYFADSLSQTRRLGELHHAIAAGLVDPQQAFPELGQVIAGQVTGRQTADAITLCDLTGTGVQDTAIATLVLHLAIDAGAGMQIDTKQKSEGTP